MSNGLENCRGFHGLLSGCKREAWVVYICIVLYTYIERRLRNAERADPGMWQGASSIEFRAIEHRSSLHRASIETIGHIFLSNTIRHIDSGGGGEAAQLQPGNHNIYIFFYIYDYFIFLE